MKKPTFWSIITLLKRIILLKLLLFCHIHENIRRFLIIYQNHVYNHIYDNAYVMMYKYGLKTQFLVFIHRYKGVGGGLWFLVLE